MKCQSCRLINPDIAIRCSCGYILNANPIPESRENLYPSDNGSIQFELNGIAQDIPIPFGSIVFCIIKLFISFIPVFIILALIFTILYAVFRGLLGNLFVN